MEISVRNTYYIILCLWWRLECLSNFVEYRPNVLNRMKILKSTDANPSRKETEACEGGKIHQSLTEIYRYGNYLDSRQLRSPQQQLVAIAYVQLAYVIAHKQNKFTRSPSHVKNSTNYCDNPVVARQDILHCASELVTDPLWPYWPGSFDGPIKIKWTSNDLNGLTPGQ